MTEQELTARAIEETRRAVAGAAREPRVVHCESESEWVSEELRSLSEHRLNVLSHEPDLVVFFDRDGKEIGWRDDGRRGGEQPSWIDRKDFRERVVKELDLPEGTRLGELIPRKLPPLGWTHEGVFFLAADPTPEQVLRVWMDPKEKHVIQCLFGPLPAGGGVA